MKKIISALCLSALAATVGAATYKIDGHHTNARFGIDHFKTSTNVGGFYNLSGTLEFDPAKRTGSIDLSIPVDSIQSGSQEFTNHLKSADLFNAAKYPEIRFTSTKFNFNGRKLLSVDGKLTMLGKTHPVKLKAQKFNCYDSPILKTQVCGGDFTATIDRTKWGMNYLLDAGITKHVSLNIQIEAGKK
ncbi:MULTISPECIES: YceI family protein [Neisseria]|uniref:Polyisoprenoid-binding protein n=1 Tax=Neisseria dumasiana TaxID=1931275 RepID=A0A1X3DIG6_9NEIS|nr:MULTISPECIES: YceI family protein [Neisseria]KPN74742.1 hypothetical protein AKG43_01545 [Neisseria sp. 74A18]OSI22407.1 polyisoprenoid-binding protein [Neisseria dumasiana]OSI36178.1 polyisoprenoid-binding protein [Neisseria dumasiana]UOO83457.1 YceI family protein [Neisseria dumasiana]